MISPFLQKLLVLHAKNILEYTNSMTDNHFICSVLRILQINNVIRKVHAITLETEMTSKVLNEVLNWILCLLVVSSR